MTFEQHDRKRFLARSSIYALGDLLTKSVRFILIPYYVHVLTTEEVGLLAILQAILLATWSLLSLGLSFAIKRFYFDYGERGDAFFSALWWGRIPIALVPYCLLLGLAWLVSPHVSAVPLPLVWLAITAGFLKAGLLLIESWFIIREEPVRYRTFTFLQFLSTTVLVIYFVSGRGLGVPGALLGETLSYFGWTLVSAWIVTRAARPQWRGIDWRGAFAYCLPVLPHMLFMWALVSCDRLILKRFVGLDRIGVYEVGYMMATIPSVFALSMVQAWVPHFFRNAAHDEERKEYGRTATLFCFVIFYAAMAAAVLAPEIIAVVAPPAYADAVTVLRVVVIGMALNALFVAINQPLFYAHRIGSIAMASGVALLVNVGLNLLLIPRFEIVGAAMATVGSYFVLALCVFLIVRGHFPIEWELPKVAMLAGVAGALGIAGSALPQSNWPLVLPAKLLLIAAFAGCLLLERGDAGRPGITISTARLRQLLSALGVAAPPSQPVNEDPSRVEA